METQSNKTDFLKDRKKRLKGNADLTTMVYGKVPPQARDIEEGVLGAIMIEKNVFDTVSEIITSECFYVDAHQRIFKAMECLRARHEPIDILTVVEQLRKNDELDIVGGPYYVTKLTNCVASSAHADTHCKIIYQKFLQRELIRIGGQLISDSYEDSTDAFELLEEISKEISNLSIRQSGKAYTSLQENSVQALEEIRATSISKKEITGVPSGIRELDIITQGFQPSNLIIIAARPSVGKSAIAANIARNAALHPLYPTAVAVFSLEMSSIQWTKRMMAAEAEIDGWDIKRGRLDEGQMKTLENITFNVFANAKVFFDDTASMTMTQLKSKCRQLVLHQKVGMIVIDYLQLMTGAKDKNGTREQEISGISRELKQLAKELHVPVIALSQLSRKGDNTEPKLSDLRESGAIEQDADDVLMLIPTDDETNDADLKNTILIKIAKHRDGVRQPLTVRYVKKIQKIMDEGDYLDYLKRTETKALASPNYDFDNVPDDEQFY